jgi:hypothetical protein
MLTGEGSPGAARATSATQQHREHGGPAASETSVRGRQRYRHRDQRRRDPWQRLACALAVAAACAALFALALRQSRTAVFNADGAANVLQAQAMLHGNLLLSGWWTSDVSF